MKLSKTLLAGLAMACTVGITAAHASATVGGSLGFTPTTTIDFEQAAEGASLNSYYSAQGVTFDNLWEVYDFSGVFPPDLSGGGALNSNGSSPDFTFAINFSSPVKDAGLSVVTNLTSGTFSTYLGSTLVESITYSGQYQPGADVISFTNSDFNRIVYTGDLALIDNLAFSGAGVPEPATWAMLILGVGMVGFAARRRNAGAPLAA